MKNASCGVHHSGGTASESHRLPILEGRLGSYQRARSEAMTRFASAFVLATAILASYAPAGCKEDEHGTGPTDAIFAGTANDEGLAAFDAATPTTDAAKAPALTAPTAGAKVPAASPAAFSWKATPTGFLLQPSAPKAIPRYEGDSPFGPMRAAHAHGDPMNGKAYLLTLRSNGSVVARVFTTATTYTPDDETWTKLKTAKSIEATLASAQYDNNNIVQGSGPFVAPGVAFTIE